MLRAVPKVNNVLIQLIVDGRIRTLEDLRATYHKLAMQTHPDAVGSDKLVRKFLEFSPLTGRKPLAFRRRLK
jgi:hypothetical protein